MATSNAAKRLARAENKLIKVSTGKKSKTRKAGLETNASQIEKSKGKKHVRKITKATRKQTKQLRNLKK